MSTIKTYWKSVPRKSLVGFMLGVFLLFSTIGFAIDITEMGRQPMLRYVMSILLSGIFPVFYAFSGFALRRQASEGDPAHLCRTFCADERADQGAALLATGRADGPCRHRIAQQTAVLDALAIMAAVGLGYGCFFTCLSPSSGAISGCTRK